MTARIPPVRESDDPRVRRLLGGATTWNVSRVIANAPVCLEMMRNMTGLLARGSLSRADREAIDLTMAEINGCHYCTKAHVKLAREAGLDEADIKAIVEGRPAPGARANLIQAITRRLDETRGGLSDDEIAAFRERGLSDGEMIEVIGVMALCTLTNFTNRLAQTEPDDFIADITV